MRLYLNGHTIAIRAHLEAALRDLDAGRDSIWVVEPDDPERVPMEIHLRVSDAEFPSNGALYAEERP